MPTWPESIGGHNMMMLTEGEPEEGRDLDVSTPAERIRSQVGDLQAGTNEQVRGFLTRLLRDVGFPSKRGAEIMRVSMSAYFENLARPFPGISDPPRRNQSRRIRIDNSHEGDD